MKEKLLVTFGVVAFIGFLLFFPLMVSIVGYSWNYSSSVVCKMYGETPTIKRTQFNEHYVECI